MNIDEQTTFRQELNYFYLLLIIAVNAIFAMSFAKDVSEVLAWGFWWTVLFFSLRYTLNRWWGFDETDD